MRKGLGEAGRASRVHRPTHSFDNVSFKLGHFERERTLLRFCWVNRQTPALFGRIQADCDSIFKSSQRAYLHSIADVLDGPGGYPL